MKGRVEKYSKIAGFEIFENVDESQNSKGIKGAI